MGILRADRITGLGGANAIKGSTFLGTFGSATYGNQIEIQKDAELDIGNGNLTVECWFNSSLTSGYQSILGQQFYNNFTSDKVSFNFYLNSDGIYLWNRENGSASQKFGVTGLWVASTWNHVAWVREGTGSDENKIYLNGSLVGSAFTNDVTYSSEQKYHIGGNFYSQVAFGQYPFSGHISNLRMSNIARYTANFTPPTSEFAVDSNTILLTCQSPSNILKEETGKTLSHNTRENNTPAQASRFTPHTPSTFTQYVDQGNNVGSTFDGFTVFATSTYMVPPGSITRDSHIKSTGDIVSGNLIFHLDGGDSKSYAGVTTSGSIIYDLKEGTNSTGVGIATMTTGHSDFERVSWVPDNRGCFRLSSDSDFGTITGNRIEFPQISLGNDNYTINVWVKLNSLADGGDEIMHVISNKDGGPVSFHGHLRMNNGFARIGAGAYYGGWSYRYSTTTPIAPDYWHLLTWVNTAQYTGSMYVDGVLQTLDDGNTTWNSRTSNNTPLNSTAYAGSETFDGWIGQIQFYSDTLSETEILQNYNAHKCRYIY